MIDFCCMTFLCNTLFLGETYAAGFCQFINPPEISKASFQIFFFESLWGTRLNVVL